MTKPKPPKDEQFGDWTVESYIDGGGSGDVFRASRHGQPGAIKFLRQNFWTGARYERFRSEVEAVQRCSDVPGVLPLLDMNCPDKPRTGDSPWFVMGLAEPLTTALGPRASLRDVITACADIAETLAAIHERGFAHRDIKPSNLFKFEGRYAVGDFGLVDYPEKREITRDERILGPVHFIAPEMLNRPSAADGQRADVYSFAKTIWVLAAGQNYPLPGVLDSTVPAMTLSAYVADPEAALLDRLLEAATKFEPEARPAMTQLAAELRAWLAPAPSVHREDHLDLSEFARNIASKNELHYARERTTQKEQERMNRDGIRLRKMVEPTARELLDSLTAAHFLSPRLNIENFQWGFDVRGYVMATARLGEVTLNLLLRIAIPGDGRDDIRVDCQYAISFYEGEKSTEEIFWQMTTTFQPAGSIEQQEMRRLLNEIVSNFRPAVRRVLDLADGHS